jgi:hypothetical protein
MKAFQLKAFPCEQSNGMDLRDYFAAKAVAAYINTEVLPPEFHASYAMYAYSIADAMMKARGVE